MKTGNFPFNAEAQRRRERRGLGVALPYSATSAPLRLCVKIKPSEELGA